MVVPNTNSAPRKELQQKNALGNEIDFKRFNQEWTDLGLNKGRAMFLNFSEAFPIYKEI